jgi:hypothetical protein
MSETSPFLWPKDAVDISSSSSDPKGAADVNSPSRPQNLDFELVYFYLP